MHQIRFRVGLSPRPLSWILRGPTSKEKKRRVERNGTEREGRGEREGTKGERAGEEKVD